MSERERILRHLDEDYTRPYRDPIWRHIYLSEPLLAITNSLPFQKLTGIRQLGPTYLVYPGATHTRFSHSLGVFHIARRIMRSLLRKDLPPRSLARGGARVPVRLAPARPRPLSLRPQPQGPGRRRARGSDGTEGCGGGMAGSIRRDLGVDPAGRRGHRGPGAGIPGCGCRPGGPLLLSRGILSCVLDPDKLDYLNRDAYFCGVPYGIQDVDFVLGEMIRTRRGLATSPARARSRTSVLQVSDASVRVPAQDGPGRHGDGQEGLVLGLGRGPRRGSSCTGRTTTGSS